VLIYFIRTLTITGDIGMKTYCFLFFLLCCGWLYADDFSFFNQSPQSLNNDFLESVTDNFRSSVNLYAPPKDYCDWALCEAKEMMSIVNAEKSQEFFVFVDRNPDKQLVMLGVFLSDSSILSLGWDFVSTGDPKHGRDYHYTPCGIFLNSPSNFSYRAQGTKNERGWRGYGSKGKRIWDFGWQWSTKPIRGRDEPREIRLLMHATDPDFGEPKLGSVQSKGCVRISGKLNVFLDDLGALDHFYVERIAEPKFKAIISKQYLPHGFEGRFLLVADSSIS